jgi:hypothetical protein
MGLYGKRQYSTYFLKRCINYIPQQNRLTKFSIITTITRIKIEISIDLSK